jgi:hypothetical protein
MKRCAIILAVMLTGCATEHRPPVAHLGSLHIDCTNRVVYENYLDQQLKLTDFTKVEQNTEERRYYAAIKDRLWSLRSICQ